MLRRTKTHLADIKEIPPIFCSKIALPTRMTHMRGTAAKSIRLLIFTRIGSRCLEMIVNQICCEDFHETVNRVSVG